MASNPSASVLAELQTAGENLNTWGDTRLNVALQMLEAAGHGLTSHTLTGNVSLTHTNYTKTNGSDFCHKIASGSDAAWTLTVGGYERSYLIWNASSYDQVIACSGGGDSVTVYAGEVVPVYCDATNMVRVNLERVVGDLDVTGTATIAGAASIGGAVTAATTPTDNSHLTNKAYVDAELLVVVAGSALPGQNSGTRGASIVSDGTNANWTDLVAGTRITTGATATANGQPYYCDLAGGAFTLTLPASPSEEDYVIADASAEASSSNLTIGRNGETIAGAAADFTCDLGPRRYYFVYLNSDWKVL